MHRGKKERKVWKKKLLERRTCRQSNPCFTARKVQEVAGANMVRINTVKRSLIREAVLCYRKQRAPSLTKKGKLYKKKWAKVLSNWTAQDFHGVIFSDETCFEIGHHS